MADPLATIRRNQNQTGRYRRPIENRLTENQLRDLDKELEQYREKQTITFAGQKTTINPVNIEKWMMAKGALGKHGGLVLTNHTPSTKDDKRDCDPIMFEQLSADIAQWINWRARADIGWKKRMKDYAQTPEAVMADTAALKEKLTSWK